MFIDLCCRYQRAREECHVFVEKIDRRQQIVDAFRVREVQTGHSSGARLSFEICRYKHGTPPG